MEGIPYGKRLKRPGLLRLKERCLGGHMRRVYTILNSKDKITRDLLWTLCHRTRTRGHTKQVGSPFKMNTKKLFFTKCVIKRWDSLPPAVLEVEFSQDQGGAEHELGDQVH